MKVIFLDIDGVMNNIIDYDESKMETPDDMISERCMGLLNELIKSTDAKVVITSTWRLGKTIEKLESIFRKFGFIGDIIGVTPDLHRKYNFAFRGNEIYQWIRDNENILDCNASSFEKYVILDDDSDMLYWQKDNFICVDGYCGLTESVIYKAKRILN